MIEIVPADTGKFRNVVPKATEDMRTAHELAAWENQIPARCRRRPPNIFGGRPGPAPGRGLSRFPLASQRMLAVIPFSR